MPVHRPAVSHPTNRHHAMAVYGWSPRFTWGVSSAPSTVIGIGAEAAHCGVAGVAALESPRHEFNVHLLYGGRLRDAHYRRAWCRGSMQGRWGGGGRRVNGTARESRSGRGGRARRAHIVRHQSPHACCIPVFTRIIGTQPSTGRDGAHLRLITFGLGARRSSAESPPCQTPSWLQRAHAAGHVVSSHANRSSAPSGRACCAPACTGAKHPLRIGVLKRGAAERCQGRRVGSKAMRPAGGNWPRGARRHRHTPPLVPGGEASMSVLSTVPKILSFSM
jgi:hypothetical protein